MAYLLRPCCRASNIKPNYTGLDEDYEVVSSQWTFRQPYIHASQLVGGVENLSRSGNVASFIISASSPLWAQRLKRPRAPKSADGAKKTRGATKTESGFMWKVRPATASTPACLVLTG